jgi:hypothetical protein
MTTPDQSSFAPTMRMPSPATVAQHGQQQQLQPAGMESVMGRLLELETKLQEQQRQNQQLREEAVGAKVQAAVQAASLAVTDQQFTAVQVRQRGLCPLFLFVPLQDDNFTETGSGQT